jgi:hypothetical protein
VVTAARDAKDVRDQLKAWTSRHLSDLAGLTQPVARKAGRKHWWTEGGDIENVFSEEHLQNAVIYVMEKQ